MNGILVVDKPGSWTSHDVVQKVRGLLQEKKIGHTGTLDPLATGVLVLCIGKATKIIRYLESDEKEYIAEMMLGATTDTQDAEGRVVEQHEYSPPSTDRVEETLKRFLGVILQRPPAYSALKVAGVASYRLARSGTLHQHDERQVTIREIELLAYCDPSIRFRVVCSKGTYVRTLCSDIGVRLGMGAHLTSLVRTRAGMFRLENAHALEEVTAAAAAGRSSALMLSLSSALGILREVAVDEEDAVRVAHGNPISLPAHQPSEAVVPQPVRVVKKDGSLLAVAKVHQGRLCPETVLV